MTTAIARRSARRPQPMPRHRDTSFYEVESQELAIPTVQESVTEPTKTPAPVIARPAAHPRLPEPAFLRAKK